MKKSSPAQIEKESSLDHDIDRLRKQLGTLKNYLVTEPTPESLVEFDSETEEMIGEIFGSSSPMIEAYEYAQFGEAAGLMNLPEEAPEGGSLGSQRETLRQRQRVLESGLADLETRRAAAVQGTRTKKASGPRVADYMAKTIRSISMDATLREAGQLLQKLKIGSLLVQSGDEYIGCITETELAREVVGTGVDPATTTVKTCMREPIITIETSDPIVEAVRLMKDKTTRYLAVTESKRIIGVISVSDIIRYYSGVA